jgi:hypothetical protein
MSSRRKPGPRIHAVFLNRPKTVVAHQGDGDNGKYNRRGYIPRRFRSLVKESLTKGDNASSQDDALVREARRLSAVTHQLVVWTGVIAGIGILAFSASLLQWDAMRGQLAEMQADQRPWLSVSMKPVGNLIFRDRNQVSITLAVTAINYGKSPARRVEVVPEIHAMTDDGIGFNHYRRFQIGACNRAGQILLADRPDTTIFPNDTRVITIGTSGTIPAKTWPSDDNIAFVVLGCVDYLYGSGNMHGRTRFRSVIGLPADGGAHMSGLDRGIGNLPAQSLKIEEDIEGNYAD